MTIEESRNILKRLFEKNTGRSPEHCYPLYTGSGSPRKYYRLRSGDISLIGTVNDNRKENDAFFYLTSHFVMHQLPVPRVLMVDREGICYLQQDLGDVSLFSLMGVGFQPDHEALLQKALYYLVHFQVTAANGLDFSRCYPQPAFDLRAALWDLHYFKYMFLKLSGILFDELKLEEEFGYLVDVLYREPLTGFMYRDFQTRNIMVENDHLWFIDYQGGRKGPLAYDVASLLYQSRIALPETVRSRLIAFYCARLQEHKPFDEDSFRSQITWFALLRLLQTLGAYGYHGIFERKPAFLTPVHQALTNTLSVIRQIPEPDRPVHVESILEELARKYETKSNDHQGLTVTINSFSFMQGLPGDDTGNGGGFVFDCRALPNPHREESLRPLTGLDPAIREWLSEKQETKNFLDRCEALIKASITNYIDRGFQNLQVNFGCTGGMHRSVYCAEELAQRIIGSHHGLRIKIIHKALS